MAAKTALLLAGGAMIAALALSASIVLAAPASTRDPEALDVGRAVTAAPRLSTADAAGAIAIQGDGKIVAGGVTSTLGGDFALARYTPTGELDRSFGRGGKVLNALSATGEYGVQGLAIQADGKIVAAGATLACWDASHFVVARYTRSGDLDPSFGSRGRVVTAIGTRVDGAHAVAIQPDEKIVAVGWDCARGGRFALARYRRDGRLDRSFGRVGRVLTDVGSSSLGADAVVVQRDGKIVAAGSSNANGSPDFALVRYRSDGTIDETFGAGGIVLTDFGASADDEAWALAIQPDGKLVAAGDGSAREEASGDFALARYNPDGSLDPTFGAGGKVLTNVGGAATALSVALQKDGKLVAAGPAAVGPAENVENRFVLVRYHRDGRLDQAFGAGGKVLTGFKRSVDGASASAVAIQADGKAVAAGATETLDDVDDFALARYTRNGRLDPTFGDMGEVVTDFALGTRVAALSASATSRGVVVRWRTSWELDTAGFNVYRERNRRRVRANANMIRSQHSGDGADYSFVDRHAGTTTIRYWLQEVKRDGTAFLLSRLTVRPGRPPFTG